MTDIFQVFDDIDQISSDSPIGALRLARATCRLGTLIPQCQPDDLLFVALEVFKKIQSSSKSNTQLMTCLITVCRSLFQHVSASLLKNKENKHREEEDADEKTTTTSTSTKSKKKPATSKKAAGGKKSKQALKKEQEVMDHEDGNIPFECSEELSTELNSLCLSVITTCFHQTSSNQNQNQTSQNQTSSSTIKLCTLSTFPSMFSCLSVFQNPQNIVDALTSSIDSALKDSDASIVMVALDVIVDILLVGLSSSSSSSSSSAEDSSSSAIPEYQKIMNEKLISSLRAAAANTNLELYASPAASASLLKALTKLSGVSSSLQTLSNLVRQQHQENKKSTSSSEKENNNNKTTNNVLSSVFGLNTTTTEEHKKENKSAAVIVDENENICLSCPNIRRSSLLSLYKNSSDETLQSEYNYQVQLHRQSLFASSTTTAAASTTSTSGEEQDSSATTLLGGGRNTLEQQPLQWKIGAIIRSLKAIPLDSSSSADSSSTSSSSSSSNQIPIDEWHLSGLRYMQLEAAHSQMQKELERLQQHEKKSLADIQLGQLLTSLPTCSDSLEIAMKLHENSHLRIASLTQLVTGSISSFLTVAPHDQPRCAAVIARLVSKLPHRCVDRVFDELFDLVRVSVIREQQHLHHLSTQQQQQQQSTSTSSSGNISSSTTTKQETTQQSSSSSSKNPHRFVITSLTDLPAYQLLIQVLYSLYTQLAIAPVTLDAELFDDTNNIATAAAPQQQQKTTEAFEQQKFLFSHLNNNSDENNNEDENNEEEDQQQQQEDSATNENTSSVPNTLFDLKNPISWLGTLTSSAIQQQQQQNMMNKNLNNISEHLLLHTTASSSVVNFLEETMKSAGRTTLGHCTLRALWFILELSSDLKIQAQTAVANASPNSSSIFGPGGQSAAATSQQQQQMQMQQQQQQNASSSSAASDVKNDVRIQILSQLLCDLPVLPTSVWLFLHVYLCSGKLPDEMEQSLQQQVQSLSHAASMHLHSGSSATTASSAVGAAATSAAALAVSLKPRLLCFLGLRMLSRIVLTRPSEASKAISFLLHYTRSADTFQRSMSVLEVKVLLRDHSDALIICKPSICRFALHSAAAICTSLQVQQQQDQSSSNKKESINQGSNAIMEYSATELSRHVALAAAVSSIDHEMAGEFLEFLLETYALEEKWRPLLRISKEVERLVEDLCAGAYIDDMLITVRNYRAGSEPLVSMILEKATKKIFEMSRSDKEGARMCATILKTHCDVLKNSDNRFWCAASAFYTTEELRQEILPAIIGCFDAQETVPDGEAGLRNAVLSTRSFMVDPDDESTDVPRGTTPEELLEHLILLSSRGASFSSKAQQLAIETVVRLPMLVRDPKSGVARPVPAVDLQAAQRVFNKLRAAQPSLLMRAINMFLIREKDDVPFRMFVSNVARDLVRSQVWTKREEPELWKGVEAYLELESQKPPAQSSNILSVIQSLPRPIQQELCQKKQGIRSFVKMHPELRDILE